jgi:hypothetical protein
MRSQSILQPRKYFMHLLETIKCCSSTGSKTFPFIFTTRKFKVPNMCTFGKGIVRGIHMAELLEVTSTRPQRLNFSNVFRSIHDRDSHDGGIPTTLHLHRVMLGVVIVGLDLDAITYFDAPHVSARRHEVDVQLPIATVACWPVSSCQRVCRRSLLMRVAADRVVGL